MRILWLLFTAVLAVGLAPGCSNVGRDGSVPIAPMVRVASKSVRHVYVSDQTLRKVFRFPIKSGLVASAPDLTLSVVMPRPEVKGGKIVSGIALDSVGNLYVIASNGGYQQIDVYAPGSSGNTKPIRVLMLPDITWDGIALDSQDRLYVPMEKELNIYAPGASGRSRPIATAPTGQNASVTADGDLFVPGGNAISVYSTPLSNPTLVRRPCWKGQSTANESVAFSGGEKTMFVSQILAFRQQSPQLHGRIVIAPASNATCPDVAPNRIVPSPLSSPFEPGEIAYWSGSLFVADWGNAAAYQLSPVAGNSAPRVTMKGPFISPFGIAVGP